jgi:hypothetical protein
MTPEELLGQLKAGANARKAKNLDIVHAVCREQFERGSKDFSVAIIGRLSQERGGPATQSIHNKTGDDFKGLISVWANYTGGSSKRPHKVIDNPIYAVLGKIPDPAVRSVMGSVLAENTKLRGEVNLLKRNANVVIDLRPTSASPDTQQPIIILPTTALTDSEKEALRHAISEKLLEDEGWVTDESGRIMNQHGRVILKVGFISAIRKMLGCPGN